MIYFVLNIDLKQKIIIVVLVWFLKDYKKNMWILIWIILFIVLIIVHELWHFTAAKKSWVKVLEFGLWIPPKIWKIWKDKTWTEYTINRIPLWWFVKLKWEDIENKEEFFAKDSLISASFRKKMIIIFAWVFMNLILAWVLFTVSFWMWMKPIWVDNTGRIQWESYLIANYEFLHSQWLAKIIDINKKATVAKIVGGSLAEKAWISIEDKILKINDIDIDYKNLPEILKDFKWKEFVLSYNRWDENFSTNITCPEDECVLGVGITIEQNIELEEIKFGLWKSMILWMKEIKEQTVMTFNALWQLFKNVFSSDGNKRKESVNNLAGAVLIVKMWQNIVDQLGIWTFIAFWWMISLALAIFNILPIPGVDGWRALGFIIQKVFRIKQEKYFKVEWYINTVFIVFLMWLWIYIILLDLKRWWNIDIFLYLKNLRALITGLF